MAIFSSHLLNSLDGTHASNVKVSLTKIDLQGEKKILFDMVTDENGRINKEFDLTQDDFLCNFEMIIKLGDYFSNYFKTDSNKIVSDIVIRINMKNNKTKYHIPIIISPNSYSIWWSK
tara:strand:+ start:89 stop:442 length:354 start_codon:yes stop_codon:yes gene_type:complete